MARLQVTGKELKGCQDRDIQTVKGRTVRDAIASAARAYNRYRQANHYAHYQVWLQPGRGLSFQSEHMTGGEDVMLHVGDINVHASDGIFSLAWPLAISDNVGKI